MVRRYLAILGMALLAQGAFATQAQSDTLAWTFNASGSVDDVGGSFGGFSCGAAFTVPSAGGSASFPCDGTGFAGGFTATATVNISALTFSVSGFGNFDIRGGSCTGTGGGSSSITVTETGFSTVGTISGGGTCTTDALGSFPFTVSGSYNAHAPPGNLSVSPTSGFSSSGDEGGPFSPSSKSYILRNTEGSSIVFGVSKGKSWVSLSKTVGTLSAGASTSVTVTINSNATLLDPGVYSDTVSFTNTTNGQGNTSRSVSLTVNAPPPPSAPGILSVSPTSGLSSSGDEGGPFSPSSQGYTLTNTGDSSIGWGVSKIQSWVSLGAFTGGRRGPTTEGTLSAGASISVTVTINSNATLLAPGVYSDTVSFTNTTNGQGNTSRPVSLTVNLPPPMPAPAPPPPSAPGILSVSPTSGLIASGDEGELVPIGPSQSYILTNTGGSSIGFAVSKGESWVFLSKTGGTLSAGASTSVLVAIFGLEANFLAPGVYSDTVSFTNTTNGQGNTSRPVSLTVNATEPSPGNLSVFPTSGLTSSGDEGGPFSPLSQGYTLRNTGDSPIGFGVSKVQSWVSLSKTGGTLSAGASTSVLVAIDGLLAGFFLGPGVYSDTVSFTNTTNGQGNTSRSVSLTVIATAPSATSGATVTSVTGDVTIKVDGEVTFSGRTLIAAVLVGERVPVPDGAELITGADGQVLLIFEDGNKINLGPNSTFQLGSSDDGCTSLEGCFKLLVGKVRALLVAGGKRRIRTPTACACVRGTDFSVEHEQVGTRGRTTVAVFSGTVDVIENDGKITVVNAGEQVTVPIPIKAMPWLELLLLDD